MLIIWQVNVVLEASTGVWRVRTEPKGRSTKRQRTEESTGVMTFIQSMLQLKSIREKSAETLSNNNNNFNSNKDYA